MLLKGEATAEGLALKSQSHVSVIRRHLDELRADGLIQTRLEKEGRGRPRIVYSLTIDGREVFFAKYALLLHSICQAAIQDTGVENAKKILDLAGQHLARENGAPKKISSVIQFFRENGFQPELRSEGQLQLVVSKNCPILRTASEFPELICDTFHTVLLRKMVGTDSITLRQAISRGAKECIHEIRPGRI
jgi:predicted ArsR family transcriptional regulator